ncbi:hypothetical protein E5288_WYG006726 [Bos mutus]|uniref:Uncharacterized protein n=1 Tax=Bos mutus TaxID=72004 RepID=A0A6B0RHT0_9CETA|nr:hypothetical protein [Bos mutus]
MREKEKNRFETDKAKMLTLLQLEMFLSPVLPYSDANGQLSFINSFTIDSVLRTVSGLGLNRNEEDTMQAFRMLREYQTVTISSGISSSEFMMKTGRESAFKNTARTHSPHDPFLFSLRNCECHSTLVSMTVDSHVFTGHGQNNFIEQLFLNTVYGKQ